MSVNTFFDSIASVSVPVTELNSLKSRLNELQARVEAQDQFQLQIKYASINMLYTYTKPTMIRTKEITGWV